MNCKKANELMINYFDSPLGSNMRKTNKLHRHLQNCGDCREDFIAYDELMANLQFISEPMEPPADMEACVMERILSLEQAAQKRYISRENITFIIFGFVSALLGVLFALALNNDSAFIVEFIEAVSSWFNGLMSGVASLLSQYQYVFFLIAVGLVLIQSRFSGQLKRNAVKSGEE